MKFRVDFMGPPTGPWQQHGGSKEPSRAGERLKLKGGSICGLRCKMQEERSKVAGVQRQLKEEIESCCENRSYLVVKCMVL